jgi:hypothetical protein
LIIFSADLSTSLRAHAKQSSQAAQQEDWMASSQELLAMTDLNAGDQTIHVIASGSEAIQ